MKTTAKNIAIKSGEISLSTMYRQIRSSSINFLLILGIIAPFAILPNSAHAGGFNGTGTYNRYYNWTNDAASGINITASRFDTEDSGFATGLSTTITKDGQQTTTARIPFAVGLSFAGASGVAPIGDLTTGLFQTGSAGTISIQSSGSQVALFDSNGLDNTPIGIGTAATGAFTTLTTSGNFAVNTNKFTVDSSSGNTVVAGTLGVTGAITLSSTLSVTGHTTFEGVTSTGATGTGSLVYSSSPTLTTAVLGSSTATTQSAGDNSTKVATTAYVNAVTANSQNVVTGSRALNTVYHNTTGKTMWITVTTGSGTGSPSYTALTDASATPTTAVAVALYNTNVAAMPITFLVLSGNYYEIATSGGSPTISNWIEWF